MTDTAPPAASSLPDADDVKYPEPYPAAAVPELLSADPVSIVQVHDAAASQDRAARAEDGGASSAGDPSHTVMSPVSQGGSSSLSSQLVKRDASSAAIALAENRTPISITWKNVSVTVDIPPPSYFQRRREAKKAQAAAAQSAGKKASDEETGTAASAAAPSAADGKKTILNGVSGYCKPGQLLAIMGSSGAGKTSLLNMLAGRFRQYDGEVLLNGRPATNALKLHSAFVQQSDLYFKVLTVREHLLFHAELRLGGDVSQGDRYERVDAILHELGLQDVADSRIGEVGEGGISGGERRRLSFATEIISNPSLVFLDEPTSGLDSFLAEQVVLSLRTMARNGRTLICTIHQPSSEVYAMFDRVCYMARGQVAFFGSRDESLEYFSSSLGLTCPKYTNPADFIIKQLSVVPSRLDESKLKIGSILRSWDGSKEKVVLDRDLDDISRQTAVQATGQSTSDLQSHRLALLSEGRYITPFTTQMRGILWRAALTIVRDPLLTRTRAMQTIVISIIVGLIYLRLGNTQTDVQNRMGAVFLMIMNQSMGSMFGTLSMFAVEVPIYLREHQSRLYSSYAYYLARSLAEIPMQVLWPFLFVSITYWMIGLNDNGAKYIEFALGLVLIANAAISLGYAIGIAAPSVQIALALAMPILLPFLLFGGLFINVDSIPVYFYWLSYISFFKYGYELLATIVWDGVTGIACSSSSCITTGAEVLSQYGMDASRYGLDIGVLFALIVGFRALAYLFLLRKSHKKL